MGDWAFLSILVGVTAAAVGIGIGTAGVTAKKKTTSAGTTAGTIERPAIDESAADYWNAGPTSNVGLADLFFSADQDVKVEG